jgi:hypothetical protein
MAFQEGMSPEVKDFHQSSVDNPAQREGCNSSIPSHSFKPC